MNWFLLLALFLLFPSARLSAAPKPLPPLDPPNPAAGRYYTPFPSYPIEARNRRAEAVMIVELTVDPAGRIEAARVSDLIGDRALGEHTVKFAQRNWKAVVRTRNGKPVGHRIGIPVFYVIDDFDSLNAAIRRARNPRIGEIKPADLNRVRAK